MCMRFVWPSGSRRMKPRDDLLSGGTDVFVLADPPEAYLVYFDQGSGPSADLQLMARESELVWFNPGTGATQAGRRVTGGKLTLKKPAGWDDAVVFLRCLLR